VRIIKGLWEGGHGSADSKGLSVFLLHLIGKFTTNTQNVKVYRGVAALLRQRVDAARPL